MLGVSVVSSHASCSAGEASSDVTQLDSQVTPSAPKKAKQSGIQNTADFTIHAHYYCYRTFENFVHCSVVSFVWIIDDNSEEETKATNSARVVEQGDGDTDAAKQQSGAHAQSDSLSSDGDDAVNRVMRLRRQLRRRRIDTDSSSSDDSDDLIGVRRRSSNDDNASDDNEDEHDDEADDDRPKPKDPWHQVRNVSQRELGCNPRSHSAQLFRTRCGGSLSFVQRLECKAKLEHHHGCVNALHFNKSGEHKFCVIYTYIVCCLHFVIMYCANINTSTPMVYECQSYCCMMTSGTLLASGSDDLEVAVWNWNNDSPYFVFESGHRSNVFQVKSYSFCVL